MKNIFYFILGFVAIFTIGIQYADAENLIIINTKSKTKIAIVYDGDLYVVDGNEDVIQLIDGRIKSIVDIGMYYSDKSFDEMICPTKLEL